MVSVSTHDPNSLANGIAAARWFDGRSTEPHPVFVRCDVDRLDVLGATHEPLASWPRAGVRVAEVWQDHPLSLQGPDGSTLWIPASHAGVVAAWARRARSVHSFDGVQRAIASWPAAVAALICSLAVLVWIDRVGAGLAARALLPIVPEAIDHQIADSALALLSKQWPESTTVPADRRERLTERFATTARQLQPQAEFKLQFRRMASEPGFNAVALPNGVIILFDGLTQRLSDDEVMAVLGHEMGHVVHRHAMRKWLEAVGLVWAAQVALGDFSGMAAHAAGTLQVLRYSRDAEREADAYAERFLAAAGLPSAVWSGVIDQLNAERRRRGTSEVPGWLASHPRDEDRRGMPPPAPKQ